MKLLLALVLALSLGVPAFCLPKSVIKSTHRIEVSSVTTNDDEQVDFICSATAIGKHALLTATHCDLGTDTLKVDDTDTRILDRIADDRDHTIFIVAMRFKDVASFASTPLELGDEVWIRGNPIGLNQMVRYGHYAGSQMIEGDPEARLIAMFDINGWQGDSGAAVFNKHGEIVAVVNTGFSEGPFALAGCLALSFTPEQLARRYQ
jgi:hypothetical protein